MLCADRDEPERNHSSGAGDILHYVDAGDEFTLSIEANEPIGSAVLPFVTTYGDYTKDYNFSMPLNFFSPATLTIEVGDTVRWTNNAGRVHDVTADDGSFSQARQASFVFSRQFMSIEE